MQTATFHLSLQERPWKRYSEKGLEIESFKVRILLAFLLNQLLMTVSL